MIIDIHTHAFPDGLAARALEVLTANCSVKPCIDGTCGGLLASMRRAQIDVSAIMPIATKPAQARSINRWAAETNQREGLICFGSLHPLQDDWANEIKFLAESGVPGIKLHPDYQEFYVDDPIAMPIYRALADAGLILLLHAGVDIGLPTPVHCTPERLARVLDAVPGLTVIAAHMGGYDCWDDVERYIIGRDLYLDTSYSLADLGPERMASLIKAHGARRVLFGTDSPWTDQADEVAGIRALPLSDSDIAAVLGTNALRLLNGRV